MSEDTNIVWLKDRADIEQTILHYATAADFRDWTLLRSILADRLEVDFSSSGGPAMELRGEDYILQVKSLIPGFHVTQHKLSNFNIKVNGTLAETMVYMEAEHFFHGDKERFDRTVGGYYTHKLEKQHGLWKITSLKLTETWSRGDMRAFALAMERVKAEKL